MTDPWARPTGERRVVEIELTGDDPVPMRPGDVPDAPERRGRGRIPLLLAGAAIAAIVVVAVTGGGDGDELAQAPSTSFDPSGITTPPTLGTLPPATLPEVAAEATDPSPTPGRGSNPGVDAPDMTFPTEEVFDPTTITVPRFETVPDTGATDLDAYDLLTAIGANRPGDTPMRTTVAIESVHLGGLYGDAVRVVIANDPAAGRDAIRVDRGPGTTERILVDRTTSTVYRTEPAISGRWIVFDGDRFIVGTGTDSLGVLFDSLVAGPLNADTIASASAIEADDALVRLTGGTVARRWHVVLPLSGIRPYGQLLLLNVSDDIIAAGDAPDQFEFDAYVTEEGRFALVTGRFEVANIAYSFQQFFDRRPANVRIELPEEETLVVPSSDP